MNAQRDESEGKPLVFPAHKNNTWTKHFMVKGTRVASFVISPSELFITHS